MEELYHLIVGLSIKNMKIGKTKLRMSSGEVRKFVSQKARDKFEKVAQAVKHGWKPSKKK